MKTIYCIYLLILFLIFGCNQKREFNSTSDSSRDSLSAYLSMANDFTLPRVKRQNYTQKAFSIVIDQPSDSVNTVNLFKVANRYYNMDDWKNFKNTVDIILEKTIANNDTVNKLKAYSYLGDFYLLQTVSDSAFIYYSRAEKMYLQRNDHYNLAKTKLNKALLQFNAGDFLGSEIAVFNALRAVKGERKSDVIYESYNMLGVIYNEIGEYDKAIEYNSKALAAIDNGIIESVFQAKATSLNNMGYVYQNLNRHDKALRYFKEGLEQKNLKTDKPFVYAMLLDNLAYSKFKIRDFEGLPEQFFYALKFRDSLHLTSGIIVSKMRLSEYFAFKKDSVKSLQYAQESLKESMSSQNYRSVLLSLKRLSTIEPKKASIYSKQYIHINDSLQKAERKMGEKFTRIEYETDEIKSENTDLVVQNRNLILFFSGIGILGLFIFTIKTQKAKNRELLFKQQQQVANAEIYNLMISQQSTIEVNRIQEKNRVARELHDGVLGRMFGVRMNLDGLNSFQDDIAREQRKSYLTELKDIEQDIREISHDLNREKSELINNFVAIVNNLFEEQTKTYQSKLTSNIDNSIKWENISNSIKINIYRILQEALQNSNKYATANNIQIILKKVESSLVVKISDDGRGFNILKAKKGIGLQNILFRANECGGKLEIKSEKGEGATIKVTIPI